MPINKARAWLGDHMLHFGWALWGQECDCGSNLFNPLARRVDPWMNDMSHWDDQCETHGMRHVIGRIGQWFVNTGTKWGD